MYIGFSGFVGVFVVGVWVFVIFSEFEFSVMLESLHQKGVLLVFEHLLFLPVTALILRGSMRSPGRL